MTFNLLTSRGETNLGFRMSTVLGKGGKQEQQPIRCNNNVIIIS